jgi:peptide-methionine (S)-S-oxide reductase
MVGTAWKAGRAVGRPGSIPDFAAAGHDHAARSRAADAGRFAVLHLNWRDRAADFTPRLDMLRIMVWLVPATLVAAVVGLSPQGGFTVPEHFPVLEPAEIGAGAVPPTAGPELATFGSGCFWCTEAVFRQMRGVKSVVSGYSGGSVPNPTYEDVCDGVTGHAEVVQVAFDPAVVTYPELLEVFWRSHDPTTRNRQGNDVGTQYRSVIFYHNDRQRELAEKYRQKIDAAGVYSSPLVTEIAPFTAFYPAEASHQDFYANNRNQPYCRAVIGPKLDKLRKVFREKLKAE